jgi:sedoheptulose-bisphosphatase
MPIYLHLASTRLDESLTEILLSKGVHEFNLIRAIVSLGEATAAIAHILHDYTEHTYAGTQNSSGDHQLDLDIACDEAVFKSIRNSSVFAIAASEETPVETDVSPVVFDGPIYSVGFDPLDGSSIIDSNFAVGSIFGIWPGKGLLGRTGREQVASVVSLYGPRTTLIIALPSKSRNAEQIGDITFEVTLVNGHTIWKVSRNEVILQPSKKIFAPGNLRATNDNPDYDALVKYWINERYTLRYSGGMVPDVYHMFAKSGGVFSNVSSIPAPAKLRLLYEVAAIGLLVECAGGETTHETEDVSVLDLVVNDLDRRLGVCFGSKDEVHTYKKFMFKKDNAS